VYFKGKRTNNIVISKKIGSATFLGNFRQRTQLKEFLKILKKKGDELSNKANEELQ
jgi:hypothetical protein